MKDEALELIQRDLDGDLSEMEKQRLQLYLQQDPELQLVYERLKRVHDQLASLPPVTPPVSIVDRLLPQLAADQQAAQAMPEVAVPRLLTKETANVRQRRFPRWLTAGGGAAVAVCLLAGVVFMSQSSLPEEHNQTGGANDIVPLVDEIETAGEEPALEAEDQQQAEQPTSPDGQQMSPAAATVPPTTGGSETNRNQFSGGKNGPAGTPPPNTNDSKGDKGKGSQQGKAHGRSKEKEPAHPGKGRAAAPGQLKEKQTGPGAKIQPAKATEKEEKRGSKKDWEKKKDYWEKNKDGKKETEKRAKHQHHKGNGNKDD